MFLDKQIMVD